MVNDNIFKNLGLKNNTDSMTQLQVEQLGSLLPNQDTINVLEFGAGNTTTILYKALKHKYQHVNYVTYETNKQYAPSDKDITVRMHTIDDLVNKKITIPLNEVYDLVIVDGPNGEVRKYWYNLFKHNVKTGTIIHIDDAFHYESFAQEFRTNFTNTTDLFVSKIGETHGNKCWITSRIL